MSSSQETSPLDFFLYELVKNIPGKILDYGCGEGRFISFCRERGLKVFGADSYQGIYKSWGGSDDGSNVYLIENNLTPFPNAEFQLIVSNMVFEHIQPNQVAGVAKEITRILSQNGLGINIFPTKRTFIEGHIGVPAAHLLRNQSKIQKIYLHICFLLGFGYWRSESKRGFRTTVSRNDWVKSNIENLENTIFYNSPKIWKKYFIDFGCTVENVSYLLVIFRLPEPLKSIVENLCKIILVKKILNFLVELRLGIVMKITKK
jgi:SAM-dependent methyltransferase